MTRPERRGDAGRVVVVTGASDGVGEAAALALARTGDQVVVVGRSPDKTRAVAVSVGAAAGSEPVLHHTVDFADLGQVRDLAAELAATHERIDVLVDNAGLISGRRTVTDDGHELTMQVNHLGPYLLTRLLRDPLVAAGGRVIVTASAAGSGSRAVLDIDDLENEKDYTPLRAYARSKLANVMFARELASRWGKDGVTAVSFHPGLVRSRFGSSSTPLVRVLLASPVRLLMRSPENGADTMVWLATSTPGVDWTSGGYYADRSPAQTHPQADDRVVAAALWERSAELVGLPA
jgi:NAD(P)-dependent dehydrogenase (short-subunit alcohol dehydrogenase family)